MITNQANRIMKKFGGPKALWSALRLVGRELSLVSVYRWKMPKEQGGTGGLIPTSNLPFIIRAARVQGIIISETDLFFAGENAIQRGICEETELDAMAKSRPRKPRKSPPHFTLRRLAKIGADLEAIGLTAADFHQQRGDQ